MRSGAIRTRSGDRYKPSACRAYSQALRDRIFPELGPVKLRDVQKRDVQRIADAMLAEGLSPSTCRNQLMPLRVIFKRAIVDGDVAVNPCANVRLPAVRSRQPRIVTPEQAAKLLAALPERDRPLWATAVYSGLRLGELQALEWDAVDLAGGVIHVRRAFDEKERVYVAPKSRAGERKVPLTAALRDYLDELKMRPGRSDGLVFGRETDVPFDSSAVSARAERTWRNAKLEPIGFHECRHSFASFMIAAHVSPKALQVYLGHSSITTTMNRYAHLLDGAEHEAAGQLDAFLERSNTQARIAQLA
jgi:integrase